MQLFLSELQKKLSCEVRTDDISKKLYSTDASIFEITPTVVILPRTKEDLITAIKIAHTHKVPISSRGAATGIAGGCLGDGLVIDTSKYLNKILAVDYETETAVVEPGVIQDDLNAHLFPRGYRLGPDTSTGNRATIGGMVATNAAGAHALKFGSTKEAVVEIELILANGELIQCRQLSEDEWHEKCHLTTQEGVIYREVTRIQSEYMVDIQNDFPKLTRRSSGYNLDELIKNNFSTLCQLIAGSEGTLGLISKITLKICKRPKQTALCVIATDQMLIAINASHQYLDFHPYALELIDKKIIEAGKSSPSLRGRLSWLESSPEALIVVEFEAASQESLFEKYRIFQSFIQNAPYLSWHKIITDEKEQEKVWALRKSGLGLLLSKRSFSRAIAFIEDIAIAPTKISLFIEKFTSYLKSVGKEAGIYGHIGDGGLHIRPYIDMQRPEELSLMSTIMNDVSSIVKECGGALSAEHGDGLIRSWTNEKMFGKRLVQAFYELKHAFDPENLMNPGKIITTKSELPIEDLRLTPETKTIAFPTFFNFEKEGGLALSLDLCNGNGECRKKTGLMCPSFQATLDEKDSTRGRANALRSIIHGKLPLEQIASQEFYDVMDLCIQCKGCKTECPSQVDMAKMKAEYLFHYHTKKGFPLRSYLFGHIGKLFKIGSYLPSLSNYLLKTKLVKSLLSFIGISPTRELPYLAAKPFSKLYKPSPLEPGKKSIVLFIDTFTEYTTPSIGIKAVDLLERIGYNVIIPAYECCGRTLISKGLLPQAKKQAQKLIELLYPYAAQGITITGLEPSCLLTIKDEFSSFHLDQEKIDTIIAKTQTIEELLLTSIDTLKPHLAPYPHTIFFHTHCHQKALIGSESTLALLKHIPLATVTEIHSGCCGMAGSFGYETEHAKLSMQIGSLVLFPTIQANKDATIIANGTSCRAQIQDGTQAKPLHIVELLQLT